jgi:hypothetical protein
MCLYLGTMKFKSVTAYNSDIHTHTHTHTHTHRGGSDRDATVGKTPHFPCFEVLTLGGRFTLILL